MGLALFVVGIVTLALVQLYRWAVARARDTAGTEKDEERKAGTERRSWRDEAIVIVSRLLSQQRTRSNK
jgi:hypothetical protein